MKHTYLGTTGIQVSELGFGTMTFGGDADKETSAALYAAARDAGINYFDCADHYSHGLSEVYLGEFIEHERSKVVISTKCYFPNSDDVNDRGTSRKHLFDILHRSLKRLRTDYIDFFFLHRFDDHTPLEESMRTLDDMVRQGKILYPAASNFAAWQVMKAQGIAKAAGYAPLRCIQPMYNLVKRQAEVELLPMAESERIGVVSYSPLAGGLLTGKYLEANPPIQGRIVKNPVYVRRYGNDRYQETVQKFIQFAHQEGYDPTALAVKWVASHPAVTCPLIGARSVDQLNGSLKADEIDMTEELYATIASFSETPPPATDRSEERS